MVFDNLPETADTFYPRSGESEMLPHYENRLADTTVITGLGRSGTTFLAHVFHNAGYDVGADPRSIGVMIPDGGLEWHRITLISRKDHTNLPEHIPPIIKDPTFAYFLDKWIGLGQKPKHAILLARDMDAATKSHNSHRLPHDQLEKKHLLNRWYTGLRNLITHGIPVTIIPYPEIATNPDLAVLLEPWIDNPRPIIQATYEPGKTHFHAP